MCTWQNSESRDWGSEIGHKGVKAERNMFVCVHAELERPCRPGAGEWHRGFPQGGCSLASSFSSLWAPSVYLSPSSLLLHTGGHVIITLSYCWLRTFPFYNGFPFLIFHMSSGEIKGNKDGLWCQKRIQPQLCHFSVSLVELFNFSKPPSISILVR